MKKTNDANILYLKEKYDSLYNDWKGINFDDRAIFCRIYEMLLEAHEEMRTVKSPLIKLAFDRMHKDEEKTLDLIVSRFTRG